MLEVQSRLHKIIFATATDLHRVPTSKNVERSCDMFDMYLHFLMSKLPNVVSF